MAYQTVSLDEFTERSSHLSKKHVSLWITCRFLGIHKPPVAPFLRKIPSVSTVHHTTAGQVCVNAALSGICAAKHGRGVANSQAFSPRLWWESYPRGWARLSANAPSVELPFALGFGSCPADGTLKRLTKAPERKGLVLFFTVEALLPSVDRYPSSGMKTTLTHWTATAGDVLQSSVESNRQPLTIWKQPCNWLRFWWHLSGLPDTRQITEEGPALSCFRAHSSAAGEMTCVRLS